MTAAPESATTATIAAESTGDTPHKLQCMEIWGGNEHTEEAIAVPGIDGWVSSRPYEGERYGGDVHYVSMCGGGKIARFAVADVAGHGQLVGDIAGRLRRMMRKHINTPNQARFARMLNEAFASASVEGRFATAVLTTYYAPSQHLIVVNAGHPRPLWYRAEEGIWETLHEDVSECEGKVHNLPLGVIEPTDYAQFAVKLGKGDLVLLYTDSLTEAKNPANRMLGEEGLLDLARRTPIGEPQHFANRMLEGVAGFRSPAPADDDQTLVVLHHNGEAPPALSLGEKMNALAKMIGLKKV